MEIKYRTWDIEAKRWADHNQQLSEVPVSSSVNPPSVLTIGDDRYVLMPYTGLKDKNGKEIYEGDILKNNELWEVRYAPTLARFMMINTGKSEDTYRGENMSALALMDFEVVGNIFEMPDWDF
jgi:uncharacterized phage protein (TIGR01671 family)